jgi:hypothetical protein
MGESEVSLLSFFGDIGPVLDVDGLRKVWGTVIGGAKKYDGAAFDQVIASLMAQDATGDSYPHFEYGAGAWTIDLKGVTVGGVLQSALLAGILWANGLDGIPAAVASAVIPAVIALETVKLTPGEQIRFQLVHEALDQDKGRSVKAIYKRLPSKVSRNISESELADFLERLRSAGFIDRHDGKYTDRDRQSWFRITLR